MNDEIKSLYNASCQSVDKQCNPSVVKKQYTGARTHYITQCQNCGDKFGQPIAKWKLNLQEVIPPFDEAFYEKCMEDRFKPYNDQLEKQKKVYQIMKAIKQSYYKEKLNIEFDTFENFYKQYLLSDTWKAKRKIILERDNFMCTYCNHNFATDVHHINYSNVGNESEFDLLSVCHSCHLSLHSCTKFDSDKNLGL